MGAQVFLVFALTILLPIAASSASADDTEALIDRALKVSGLRSQMETFAQAFFSTIPMDFFPDPGARNEISSLVRTLEARQGPLSIIRNAIREDFREDRIREVITFYGSGVGLKVGRLTGGALAPEVLAEIQESRSMQTSLGDTRRLLLERIAAAEKVSEFGPRLLRAAVRGLVKPYLERQMENQAESKEMQRKLAALETEIQAAADRIGETGLVAFAYTFRSLKDDELEQLAVYHESDAGTWFTNVVMDGTERAVFRTAVELGEILISERRRSSK